MLHAEDQKHSIVYSDFFLFTTFWVYSENWYVFRLSGLRENLVTVVIFKAAINGSDHLFSKVQSPQHRQENAICKTSTANS